MRHGVVCDMHKMRSGLLQGNGEHACVLWMPSEHLPDDTRSNGVGILPELSRSGHHSEHSVNQQGSMRVLRSNVQYKAG